MSYTTKYNSTYKATHQWVEPHPTIKTKVKCILCGKMIDIARMGKSALDSHAKSVRHRNLVLNIEKSLPIDTFVQRKNNKSSESAISQAPANLGLTKSLNENENAAGSASSTTAVENEGVLVPLTAEKIFPSSRKKAIDSFLLSNEVTEAEIKWCLRTVMSHLSLRCSADCISTIQKIFHDSLIAQKMQLQRTKLGYSIVHGISPYFFQSLIDVIKDCDNVVVGFDESLNTISQKVQMDIHLKFWDANSSLVTSRYFDSAFLQRTRASDLLTALKASLGTHNLKKILQLSMDGPNVNLKILTDLNNEIKESFDGTALLDIGTCGLHVVHGAFKTGMQITKWDIVNFLRALYYLFKDSPTRRAHYITYTGSCIFPKKCCAIRWIENVAVAERAYEMLPHLKTYLSKSIKEKTAPSSKSFKIVSDAVNDKLFGPKLTFFSATASLLEPFLREFQTDNPMAPFLYNELHTLVCSLMHRVVQGEVLDSTSSITKIDMSVKKNLISANKFDMDFATKHALKTINASNLEILQLKEDMRMCIVKIIEKLLKRSPLKYKLTQGISCLDPAVALVFNVAQKRLTSCLDILISSLRMTGSKADRVRKEYIDLCSESQVQDAFKFYKRTENQLDKFWMHTVQLCSKTCDNFVDFLKLILILSHGNAGVERGFSINAECMIENQQEQSLIAQRRIYDTVSNSGGIQNIKIDMKFIHSMRNAHYLYQENLEKRRNEEKKQSNEKSLKRQRELEIKEVLAKKAEYMSEVAKQIDHFEHTIAELKK